KYSLKDFLVNNANLANGLAAVHGVNAYIDAELKEPGTGRAALVKSVCLEVAAQLPYVGEFMDVKDALVEGNFGGLVMTVIGKIAPELMKKYLVYTLAVDIIRTSAKAFGYLCFEPVA